MGRDRVVIVSGEPGRRRRRRRSLVALHAAVLAAIVVSSGAFAGGGGGGGGVSASSATGRPVPAGLDRAPHRRGHHCHHDGARFAPGAGGGATAY